MEVTLIRTPVLLPVGSVTAHQGVPPLGLAYLGSTLRNSGHEVHYIDAFGEKINSFSKSQFKGVLVNGLTIPEIINRIPHSTKIIGISCMFSNEWFYTEQLIHEIKKEFPKTIIVVGGEHVTADYEHVLRNNLGIDIAILGEGEMKLLALVNSLERNIPFDQIEGIAFFKPDTNTIIQTKEISRIKDVDLISWPDWSGIPLEKYLELGLGMAAQGKRTLPMLASRGCPYQCTFCSSPQMWTTKWKSRNIENLIEEILAGKKKYRISHLSLIHI